MRPKGELAISKEALALPEEAHAYRTTLRRLGIIDFILSILARGAGAPLAFAANVLIARLLGPEKFGVYMTLLSVALVVGGLATYGLGPVLTREISAAPDHQERTVTRSVGHWALRLGLALSGAATFFALLLLTFRPGLPLSTWLERVAAVSLIPLIVVSAILTGILAGLSRVAQSQALGTVLKNAALLVGVLLLLAFGWNGPADVLMVQALSLGATILVGAYWVRETAPEFFHLRELFKCQPTISSQKTRVLQHAARHFLMVSLGWLILGRVDVVIVSALSGTTQAGLFGAAARLGQLAGMAGLIWIAWLQPRMSTRFYSNQSHGLRVLVKWGCFGAGGMTAMLVIAGWYAAPQLMRLMGDGFVGAIAPFRWLLLGYLVWAVSVPFYAYLSMAGRESVLSNILWFQVFATVAASLPLVHHFGALGAAWAWSMGLAVGGAFVIVAASMLLRSTREVGS